MRIVQRLNPLGQGPAPDDIPSRQRDEERVLHIVVQSITLAQAFQSDSGNAVEALGVVLAR